jgi:hypothetical protein
MAIPYQRCPKCKHQPLPAVQTLPAACPACGVILAKIGEKWVRPASQATGESVWKDDDADAGAPSGSASWQPDPLLFWFRLALLAALTVWAWVLIRMDFRSGEIGTSFLHRPLLVFHEAGHVIFMPLGHWLSVLGGTLGQLLMPAIMAAALLLKNRDRFGAAVGAWFFGVSLLDIAPYMYDALQPQLMLLSGNTGEAGGHDWIYLLNSTGLLHRAQLIGGLTHTLGALVVILSLTWAARLLWRQRQAIAARPTPV